MEPDYSRPDLTEHLRSRGVEPLNSGDAGAKSHMYLAFFVDPETTRDDPRSKLYGYLTDQGDMDTLCMTVAHGTEPHVSLSEAAKFTRLMEEAAARDMPGEQAFLIALAPADPKPPIAEDDVAVIYAYPKGMLRDLI